MGKKTRLIKKLPSDSVAKNLPASARDVGSISGLGGPLKEEMATHLSILPGNFHGQRGLVGRSPWGQTGPSD